MRKLSQRELIEEGVLRSALKNLATQGLKRVAREISPTAYSNISKMGSAISKAFYSPKKFIESLPEQYPETIYDIKNIQTIDSTVGGAAPLYKANFDLRLRDPNTHEPINDSMSIRGIPIKGVKDKEGNTTYQVAGTKQELERVVNNLTTQHPEAREALQEFGDQVLKASLSKKDSTQEAPQEVPQEEPSQEPQEGPQEEPSQDPQEEPSQEPQEEPKQVIDGDVVSRAKQAINTGKFKRGFEDNQAIKDVKEYMQDNLSINTDQAKVTYKDRVERGSGYNPNLSGVKLTNKEARAILATESKKSQKSLLKHLKKEAR